LSVAFTVSAVVDSTVASSTAGALDLTLGCFGLFFFVSKESDRNTGATT